MLIVNDEQRQRAGIASLSKRCSYCSKALAAYPLIVSDEARSAVYHTACAAELATEILVDLYTFFRPPAPYHRCGKEPQRVSAGSFEQPIIRIGPLPAQTLPDLGGKGRVPGDAKNPPAEQGIGGGMRII